MGKQPNRRKKKNFLQEEEPIRYWLVELTLTSGEVQTFYVKAKTQFDAYERAEEWGIIYEACPKLRQEGFKLRH